MANNELRKLYTTWYSDQVSKQLANGVAPSSVKIGLTQLKHLHAAWITKVYETLITKNDNIINGFWSSGILDAVIIAKDHCKDPNPFR